MSFPFRKRKPETQKPKAACKQALDPFHDIGAVDHVLARRGGERAVKNEHHKRHGHKNQRQPCEMKSNIFGAWRQKLWQKSQKEKREFGV